VTDLAWIDVALTGARPRVVAALLRYFRDLDLAEEAFQEACLRALKTWPEKGPPDNPDAWLIFVGRNSGIDATRRRSKEAALPDDETLTAVAPDRGPRRGPLRRGGGSEDIEGSLAERLDREHYRDDILRLLFICCHPGLHATQQIALALRIVSGLSVKQIARAFLVSEAAMEQRITRAKRTIGAADVPFEAPGTAERASRLAAVAAMIYLLFNEGYSAAADTAAARLPLCDEAIRLARLLLRLFPSEPEIMGLMALLLLQHARAAARVDLAGSLVLLEDQDRSLWDRTMIAEGLALIDKAMRHSHPTAADRAGGPGSHPTAADRVEGQGWRAGPYQIQAAIAATHARAARAEDTDWAGIDRLYAALEEMQPSPVVTLNRAVAVSKVRGPEAALATIDPLADRLAGYFYFHGVRGALLMQLGRSEDAYVALTRAIALANTAAEAAHIRMHLDRLVKDSLVKDSLVKGSNNFRDPVGPRSSRSS
jgi:RNA polymerase sigma-70 factor (ECF subfamily)